MILSHLAVRNGAAITFSFVKTSQISVTMSSTLYSFGNYENVSHHNCPADTVKRWVHPYDRCTYNCGCNECTGRRSFESPGRKRGQLQRSRRIQGPTCGTFVHSPFKCLRPVAGIRALYASLDGRPNLWRVALPPLLLRVVKVVAQGATLQSCREQHYTSPNVELVAT